MVHLCVRDLRCQHKLPRIAIVFHARSKHLAGVFVFVRPSVCLFVAEVPVRRSHACRVAMAPAMQVLGGSNAEECGFRSGCLTDSHAEFSLAVWHG